MHDYGDHMGLTRIRAEQISDIDYKQAVRVISLSNVTLSGGAPATVDGVNLSVGNRVLVAGQGTGSQNGLYIVQTVGAGSNGTWIRSSDGNADGEIEAGMIVMVTEGDIYKDTQWKLTTNDPIVIGTTSLVFEQNSAYAFGNIYANGTAVLANAVGGTVTFTAGDNIAITGNNTSKTVTIGVTGISLNSIANGTSNVTVVSSGGNVSVGVGGISNIAVFNSAGVDFTGNLLPTANVTYNLGSTNRRWKDLWLSNSTIYLGSATISATEGNLNLPDNVYIGTAALSTHNNILSLPANTIMAGMDLVVADPNGDISANGTVSAANITSGHTISSVGNVTGGNMLTGGIVSATGNISGGNLITANQVTAIGNVTGGNLATLGTVSAATLSTTGNATIGGNLAVQGNLIYVNVEDLRVEDPVILMGTGTNGAPLTSDDGQDRGIYMEYYTTYLGNAFVGWQNSSGNLIAASNVSFSSNNIISVTEYGTLQAGNLYVESVISQGNINGGNILGNGAGLTGINVFSNIAISGGNACLADSIADTLILTAGSGVVLTADAATDTITIATSGSGQSIFATGGDIGLVNQAVVLSQDLGLVSDAVTESYDLGTIIISGVIVADSLVVPTYTVSTLPSTSPQAQIIFVSNESGGAVLAFSDGTNWRRCTDRAIVT